MSLRALTILVSLLSLNTTACSSSKSSTEESLFLMQGHWVLIELQERPVIHEGINRQASLDFTAEGNKVTGSTSCNRLFGTFNLSGDEKIQFSKIGTTRMACPDMSTENAFLKALETTTTYSISGKELSLKHDDSVLARLRVDPTR